MKRVTRSLLFLILGLPCWLAARAATPVAHGGYRITGTAVSSRDGGRVPFCRLLLLRQTATAADDGRRGPDGPFPGVAEGRFRGRFQGRTTSVAEAETRADAQGRFTIEVPGAGKWRLRASARGFRLQDYDAHEGFFTGIVLSSTQPSFDVLFRLIPDATISGLVTDDAGEPVRAAQVFAEVVNAEGASALSARAGAALTDDRGRYEIGGLAPDTYRLRVEARPWYAEETGPSFQRGLRVPEPASPMLNPALDVVYAPVWFPGVEDETRAQSVVLADGEDRQADFQLVPIPAAHLRLPVSEAAPAAENQDRGRERQMATLIRVSPPGNAPFFTQVGGNYDFGGLSPGLYELREGGPDGGVRQIRISAGASGFIDPNTATPLDRVQIATDGSEDRVARQVSFLDLASGRVTSANDGMRGMLQRLNRAQNTQNDGSTVVFLAPGRYRVSLPTNGPDYLTGITGSDAKITGDIVELTGPAPSLTLHVASGKTEISGFVSSNGRPLPGAMVLLVPASYGQPGDSLTIVRDQSNSDGSFLLRDVVPGRYILVAIDHGWTINWRDLSTLSRYLPSGTPVQPGRETSLRQNLTAVHP